jgi:hypothetical protein
VSALGSAALDDVFDLVRSLRHTRKVFEELEKLPD